MANSYTRILPEGHETVDAPYHGSLDVPYNLARGPDEQPKEGKCDIMKRSNDPEADDDDDTNCESGQNSTSTASASRASGTLK